MEPKTGRDVSVALRCEALAGDPHGLDAIACLRCGSLLEVHQPDAALPDRMVATCEACRAWHLLDRTPDAGPAVLVLLPDAAPFRAALGPK